MGYRCVVVERGNATNWLADVMTHICAHWLADAAVHSAGRRTKGPGRSQKGSLCAVGEGKQGQSSKGPQPDFKSQCCTVTDGGLRGGGPGRPPCWRTLKESCKGLGSVSLKINNQHTQPVYE
jgi:hypothetical protein